MIDFLSWSHEAVLSPSQWPPQRPEEGNVERVMTTPRCPVTSCTALVGKEQGGIEGELEDGQSWDFITERRASLEYEAAMVFHLKPEGVFPGNICYFKEMLRVTTGQLEIHRPLHVDFLS